MSMDEFHREMMRARAIEAAVHALGRPASAEQIIELADKLHDWMVAPLLILDPDGLMQVGAMVVAQPVPEEEGPTVEDDIGWCRNLFEQLNENGGVWGVPRSGLIFHRHGERLCLASRLQWTEGMPISEEQLDELQESDFEVIKDRFALAGIPVVEGDDDDD
jgi:hypothetical protein